MNRKPPRMPDVDLSPEGARRLSEIIARNDAAREAAGISVADAIRLNVEHARRMLAERRSAVIELAARWQMVALQSLLRDSQPTWNHWITEQGSLVSVQRYSE